jgi:hypothetical protein
MATCSVDPTHPVVGQADGPACWCPKYLREALCKQSTFAPDEPTREAIGVLIRVLDQHRPLGSDGKHGNRHTRTCGCEDVPRCDCSPYPNHGPNAWPCTCGEAQ